MLVSANQAMAKPSEHIFVPGMGYARIGELKPLKGQKQIFGMLPTNLCYPAAGARDKSWHALQPPGDAKPICFQWLTGAKEWFRLNTHGTSRRLGFSPEYLSSHGWTYHKAANGRNG